MRLLLILIFLPVADALTLGVSPPEIRLGEVEPGKNVPISVIAFNPEPEAQSFVVEGLSAKKTVRVKARGKAVVDGMIEAPEEPGNHTLLITFSPKTKEPGMAPGISVKVTLMVKGKPPEVRLPGLQPAGQSITASAVSEAPEGTGKPNGLVGGAIIGGIVGPGLFFYRMVRRRKWRKPNHKRKRGDDQV
ncbi:MAG: hypothetical protein V1735_05180 [Nanoarchaeota archaeon]